MLHLAVFRVSWRRLAAAEQRASICDVSSLAGEASRRFEALVSATVAHGAIGRFPPLAMDIFGDPMKVVIGLLPRVVQTGGVEVGQEWVYRPRALTSGTPVFRVRVEKIRPSKNSKLQVRILDGEDDGLLTRVSKISLKAPRGERDAWLADDDRYAAAVAVSWQAHGTPEYEALVGRSSMRSDLAMVSCTSAGNRPVRGLLLVQDLP